MPFLLFNTSGRACVLTRDLEETRAFSSAFVVSVHTQTEHHGAGSGGTSAQSQMQGCSPLHHIRLSQQPRQGAGVGCCLGAQRVKDTTTQGLLQIPQEGAECWP